MRGPVTMAGVVLLLVAIGAPTLMAETTIQGRLDGAQETPSVSTTGTGVFRATINDAETAIDYEISYENLEGATTTASHIHLGQMSVAGGVAAFLCGGGGKPACPATTGMVTGTIVAADVIGPAGQGIAAGEFSELLRAIRQRITYVNVHTDKHPGGEIRGQIRRIREPMP